MISKSVQKEIEIIYIYKFFAAFLIILIHLDLFVHIKISSYINFFAVHFFFVLSGFLYGLKNKNNYSFKSDSEFLKRKLFKLYPLHLLILIIYLILELMKYLLPLIIDISPNYMPFNKNNFDSFLSNIFLMNAFIGNPLSYNGPSWFLSALIYSFIIFLFFKNILKNLIFLFIPLFIFFYIEKYSETYFYTYGFYTILNSLFGLTIGFLLSCLIHLKICKTLNLKIISIITISISLIYNFNINAFITFMFSFILLVSTKYKLKKNFFKFFIIRKLVYLGKISFSIYMLHSLIFWIITQFLNLILKVSVINVNGIYKIDLNIYLSMLVLILSIQIIFYLSNCTYKLIEINLSNYLVNKFK